METRHVLLAVLVLGLVSGLAMVSAREDAPPALEVADADAAASASAPGAAESGSSPLGNDAAAGTAKPYVTFDKAAQAGMTPDKALEKLKAGNQRFVSGKSFDRDYGAQVSQTAEGQYPFAVVMSCLDSRSTPEKVFDSGIGDLFVGRVAGNVLSDNMLGSFEFATKVAGAKLIVVMGHTSCGAVMGACDGVEMGHLTTLLSEIKPAIDATMTDPGEARDSSNADFVRQVTELNAKMQVNEILRRSDVIRDLVEQGEVQVVPAMHDIATGHVEFL